AVVSHSNFDPNLFARGISEEDWIRLKQDPEKPLQNRAVSGEYAPASTFKIIVTAAALETHKIDEGETLLCKGELPIGNRVFRCWKEEGHGRLNLEEAVIHSCDVFFYQLGLRVGVEKIIEFARLFGLGRSTGIDLISEGRGLLPSSSWKLKKEGEPWYGGDTANLSIGQGYILVTPLQMLNVISAIANGGKLFRPYLVKKIVSSRSKVIKEFSPYRRGKVPLSSSTLSLLRRSLRGVVKKGTGWRAKSKVVKISGKTGTVEFPGEERPHNWFIGYAPSDNPSVSIVVLVEHREEDISIAAEIAGKILSQWFSEQSQVISDK
ncbi:MAG: penicillin-binding transpeptidase domain-containing protein, partial [Candidatus Aerophobetes bacterium]|nr:penicillin-binding transpeptidase domain-containing protein [Candidatus Aerophobetes bacterium]